MHVGKVSCICPKLEVHGTAMQKIKHDKYLGDIVTSNGTNYLNSQSRVNKGVGNVTKVMNMIEKVTEGKYFPKCNVNKCGKLAWTF